jgi:hypothetical protein
LHQAVTFPLPPDLPPGPPGLYQHHVAGSGYPERTTEPSRPTWWTRLKRLLGR